jgi:hypothetical protein
MSRAERLLMSSGARSNPPGLNLLTKMVVARGCA